MNKEEDTNKHFNMVQESYYIIGNFINGVEFTYKEKREIVDLWTKLIEYKPYKEFLKVIDKKSKEIEKKKITLWTQGAEC